MRRFLVAVFVSCLAIPALVAQSQLSSIQGTVTDASNEVLAGVEVELLNPQGSRLTMTDGSGRYVFRNLPAGPYTLKFSLLGFVSVERRYYQLLSNFNARVDGQMRVGPRSETIIIELGGHPVVELQKPAALDRDPADKLPGPLNLLPTRPLPTLFP